MPKKSVKHNLTGERLTGRSKIIISVGLMLSLVAVSGALAQWRSLWPYTTEGKSDDRQSMLAPSSFNPSAPSKEYVYAGGKLVATEAPIQFNNPALYTGLIATMAFPFTPAQADVVGEQALSLIDSTVEISESIKSFLRGRQDFHQIPEQDDLSALERSQRVTRLRLCPRRVTLYSGESRTLVPMAINHLNRDQDGEPEVIHGAVVSFESSDPTVATVTSYGEVEAVSPGRARITAQSGSGRAVMLVDVEPGVRPVEEDFEYDPRHVRDCEDPEAEDVEDTGSAEAAGQGRRRTARSCISRFKTS